MAVGERRMTGSEASASPALSQPLAGELYRMEGASLQHLFLSQESLRCVVVPSERIAVCTLREGLSVLVE